MKHGKTIIIVISLIASFLFLKDCEGSSTETIVVPEIINTFEAQTPVEVIRDTIYKDSIVYKDEVIKIENPVNKELAINYLRATDSISKLNLYLDAIQIRTYKDTFEDEHVSISYNAEVQGRLLRMTPSYTIKQRLLEHKVKETKFALYAGPTLSTTPIYPNITFGASVGIQNVKGSIIWLNYNFNKTYGIGYNFKLIDIKR